MRVMETAEHIERKARRELTKPRVAYTRKTTPMALYVVSADELRKCKVGVTHLSDIEQRVASLSRASPVPLRLHQHFPVSRLWAWRFERCVHQLLSWCRLHAEWFDCGPDQAVEAINRALELYREVADQNALVR